MSSQLIIKDLNYLESVTEKTDIVGGEASATTQASASYGFSEATAGALAKGKSTLTNTQTVTNTYQFGPAFISYADATASAYARTKNNVDIAYSNSTAYYIGVS